MNTSVNECQGLKIGIIGAWMTISGILLSGPIGILVVYLVQMQPAWKSCKVFVANYHPIQTFPFFCGFLLVGGYVVLMAALYRIADSRQKASALIAVMLTTAFSALIFLNYINQTTFIPALVKHYRPSSDPIIETFSLANPCSLSWAIEMWGYALLGIATWCVAPLFNRTVGEKITGMLMVLNGMVSIAGGVMSAVDLQWVLTVPGAVAYAVWNLLVLAISVGIAVSLRRRSAVAGRDGLVPDNAVRAVIGGNG